MNQTLHVLLVDIDDASALATWRHGRWLLPVLNLPERARCGRPVAAWARGIGLSARVVGQWLGRPAPNHRSMDWLVVARVYGSRPRRTPGGLRWTPTPRLAASASWMEYQQWALIEVSARGRPPLVSGPFGSVTWLDRVEAWVAEVLDAAVVEVTPYRTSAYEVAVGFTTRRGRAFFKGIPAEHRGDAQSAHAICAAIPHSFAPTVAFRVQADGSAWWLSAECPGVALAEHLTVENVERVAGACGELQQAAAQETPGVLNRVPRIDLSGLAEWAGALLQEATPAARTHHGPIERACALVESATTESLVHVDLDPGNVFLRGHEVRFIDLNEMHRGPSPLMASMFADRLVQSGAARGRESSVHEAVRRGYVRTESRTTGFDDCQWSAIDVVSTLFSAYLGWKRVQTKVRHGEVRDVDGLVRMALARRIANAIRTAELT